MSDTGRKAWRHEEFDGQLLLVEFDLDATIKTAEVRGMSAAFKLACYSHPRKDATCECPACEAADQSPATTAHDTDTHNAAIELVKKMVRDKRGDANWEAQELAALDKLKR